MNPGTFYLLFFYFVPLYCSTRQSIQSNPTNLKRPYIDPEIIGHVNEACGFCKCTLFHSATSLNNTCLDFFAMQLQTLIFHLGRALLQLQLLAVFFYFFGLPAIERFLSREVMISWFSQSSSELTLTTITQVMEVKMKRDTSEGIPAPV